MTIRIGSVEVDRVVEWVGPIKTVDDMFPDTPAHRWTDELAPHHWTPSTRGWRAAVQTWVLRSAGRIIVIDTGVGNDRDRPQAPTFDHLSTDYLRRLAEIGVQPADVNIVINTHIHYDHVGWNTQLDGATWLPTIPNATYLVPAVDYDYFHPDNAERMRPPRTADEKPASTGSGSSSTTASPPSPTPGNSRLGAVSTTLTGPYDWNPHPDTPPDRRWRGSKRAPAQSSSAT